MVKKCLIVIAVVGLLATTVQAGSPAIKKEGDWPYTYIALPICTIPVILEVGHYVQIQDCHDLEMKLDQVDCDADIMDKNPDEDFPCYRGCVTFNARANFPAIFGADFSGGGEEAVDIITEKSLDWPDGNELLNGEGADWEELKLCMRAWQVKLWESNASSGTVKVGTITINVKPPDGP